MGGDIWRNEKALYFSCDHRSAADRRCGFFDSTPQFQRDIFQRVPHIAGGDYHLAPVHHKKSYL
jgi:hypothetical protein